MHLLRNLVLSLAVLLLSRHLFRRLHAGRLEPGAVALITGGNSGVGLELARSFSRAGCHVVLVGRNETTLRESQAQCLRDGAPSARFIAADISTKEGVQKVGTAFAALHGERLKYLVLSAGVGAIVPFSSDEHFTKICKDMININYYANVHLLQLFLPQLTLNHDRASPSRIIVLSSLAGVLPSILRSAYTASKHAIQGFVKALRGETDVPITLCCPSYVKTNFHRRVLTSGNQSLLNVKRHGKSAAQCAQECLQGALRGDAEVMDLIGKLGCVLRPLLTNAVDVVAKRMSLKSIEIKTG